MASRQRLSRSVMLAWQAFDHAVGMPSHVVPAAPILFFGDFDAYKTSPLRIVTVGLNPSLHEFPAKEPFRRFPLTGDSRDREPSGYLDAMSAYFRNDPYRSWFGTFDRLLNGAGSSYYEGEAASVALHTDLCSPIATNPTWSKLGQSERSALEADGVRLWHILVETLQPQILVLSVARHYLGRICFAPLTECWTVRRFERTRNCAPRKRPYEARARWCDIGGQRPRSSPASASPARCSTASPTMSTSWR